MGKVLSIVLLGAPGAGKGTQAARICKDYSLPHISTGNIFRANIQEKTELGLKAKSYMDKGLLVPDSVVIDIVKDRLEKDDCKNGYVLDGFPRTVPQAEALSQFAKINFAINIEVVPAKVIDRIASRRVCKCGATYDTHTHPSDICDVCGEKLFQREDDKEETVKARLDVYEKQTAPLIEFYDKANVLKNVNGDASIDDVYESIKEILG